MMDRGALEGLFRDHEFEDFRWIDAADIEVQPWVRMKCMFGCDSYGRKGACPPNTPSVDECRDFFASYQHAAVFHFEKKVDAPEDRKPWSLAVAKRLYKLEREVFLAGHRKAFMLMMDECRLCKECTGSRAGCQFPDMARPSPEGLSVDVYATVRRIGYPIEVLKDYDEPMNRYAFLMVE